MPVSLQARPQYRLGVDIGGTFTDIVLLGEDGAIHTRKLLSSPPDYSEAIEVGVAQLLEETGVAAAQVTEFAHGTTIVTNTIIERKGSRVALLTTRGFRDVLELGRFRTPRLYDRSFRRPEPLAERRLRFEVTERTDAEGKVLTPVDPAEIAAIAGRIAREDVATVAICFMNAYVNGGNEMQALRLLEEALPGLPVSASSQLLPQIQEYERTSTTVVNAYVRPVAQRYLDSLVARMRRIGIACDLMIMQSSGGSVPAAVAARNPVTIIESGPAAGVVGGQRLTAALGLGDVMVVDVGGTTAKAALVEDGGFTIATEAEVGGSAAMGHRLMKGGGYAVQAPTIDIAEVGAGGGSIAQADLAGGLKVGPRSAGAVPGPICYDRGGTQPTVTDANLVLGYISPKALVGGDLALNREKAEIAIVALGRQIGLSPVDTAYGIHLIANSNMMRALNGVSSERGRDPSQFRLFAIGGNGAVHGTKLADDLRMDTVIVPPVAGVFSALGLLFADVEHQVIRAYYRNMADVEPAQLSAQLAGMAEEARRLLASGGFAPEAQEIRAIAEVRYFGQMTTLPVTLASLDATQDVLGRCAQDFARAHEASYGYSSPAERLQFVALKVLGRGLSATPRVPRMLSPDRRSRVAETRRPVYFGPGHGWLDTPVTNRAGLSEWPRPGPMVIEEYDSTSVVRPGWTAELDAWSNIVMRRSA